MNKVFVLNSLGNFAGLFIIPIERLVLSIAEQFTVDIFCHLHLIKNRCSLNEMN